MARGAKHARLVFAERGGERRERARLAEEQFVLLRERSTQKRHGWFGLGWVLSIEMVHCLKNTITSTRQLKKILYKK